MADGKGNKGPPSVPRSQWRMNAHPRSFTLYDKDVEVIEWIADFIGCGKSEVVRTAVRSLAGQLANMQLPNTRPTPEGVVERPKRGRPAQ